MFDYLGVLALVLALALFVWLLRRSWRSSRPWLKWSAGPLCALLSLVLAATLVVSLYGFYRLNKKYDNPISQIEVVSSAEAIARGEKYARLCAGCHSENESLPMGGNDFMGDDAPPIGRLFAPNLTPTHLADWSDGEIIRAIREGIHKDGRSLLIMPSRFFRSLSDDHVAAIVAYLRSQEPIEPDTPPAAMNVIGAILINIFEALEAQEPVTEPIADPTPGVTAEYGDYLSSITCNLCHGADLRGDDDFGSPDLRVIMPAWSEEQLITLMRTGMRPSGVALDAELMPWELIGGFLDSDDDLRAVYRYISGLETASPEE